MIWQKMGRLFAPAGEFPWMLSHAANPFAWHIEGTIYKVFFTCRDKDNRSHIGFVVIDITTFDILELSSKPVLAPGATGLFDDSGVAMAQIVPVEGKLYLYYLGWNLKVTVPWQNSIGLAISEDNGKTFQKYGRAPIVDRSNEDPYSISYPYILPNENELVMWYGSNLNWGADQSQMQHVIKRAVSSDGISWTRNNDISIDLLHQGEYALSKPFVERNGSHFDMWYSYRAGPLGDSYRIGRAESVDGIHWIRHDEAAGIDVSKEGWDSEMIEYPFLLDFDGNKYMLYNGNGYGKTGFGLAIQIEGNSAKQ